MTLSLSIDTTWNYGASLRTYCTASLTLTGTHPSHKDYLHQRKLAEQLPLDSFRFDFRGNHESTGKWSYSDILGHVADIQTAVDYLKNTFGYVPQLIVSHSLGSLAAFYWICHTADGQRLPAFVNVSGRYRMKKLYESTNKWQKSLNEQGYYELTVPVARKPVTFRIYLNDFEKFANWDTAFVWHKFPATTDVLTVHGMSDITVPPGDALIYAKALGARRPGTHALHLMEGADHNFTGHIDELIGSILEWWELRRRGGLNTEIWLPHVQESTKL
ncbi:hypothetical protein M378DRAFT_9014 [Amanita muscaria Koide BX008]|uniref:Uncharacterized protein n=1 Tax=Amanita muscaria (strain Koide BX008) TaxID=946122 RepID=A0A0C2X0U4_AMAMK|nr:hypothetical protein M378DRAFT_9014 [Amanita muscaria Koide BX008]